MKAQKPTTQTQPVLDTSATSKPVYLALSFVFPFIIMGAIFALRKVYPFGDKQILIHDFSHQYYPFLSGLWHKLREGGIAPWSWTAGMGHDYVALIAYYLSCPLNLLAMIVPHEALREALTVTLLIKIGCAGLFTGIYLRYAHKECGPALPVFSSLYALCAFTIGYYHNIIWFDSFALLPLVITGLLALMNEGKFRLYIVSLAMAVFTNYYMGFFVCIMTAITFFCQCIIQKLSLRDFLRKLGITAACSCLAIGLTAVLTLPAWSALQNYHAQAMPPTLSLFFNFFKILGNFIAFTPATKTEGLPNVYCGLICIILAGLFLQSKKIALREKILFAALAVFFVLSLNIDALSYMMHGFHFPESFPARFSFLVSFMLIVFAYRVFSLTENIDKYGLLAMGISATLFLLSAIFGSFKKSYIIGSAVLCALYITLLYFLMKIKNVKVRAFIKATFFLLILAELSVTSFVNINDNEMSKRDWYPDRNNQIQALLSRRQPDGDNFYRTDMDFFFYCNEPYLYNYNGISFSSSTVNYNVLKFMQGLGLDSNRSKYTFYMYTDTSPLTNAFLNIRYMISPRDNAGDKNVYWKALNKFGDSLLLENNYYLPLGFMVNKKLAEYQQHDNTFLSQNNLFRLATGLSGDLFEVIDISDLKQKKRGLTSWVYQAPETGMVYAYFMVKKAKTEKEVVVYIEGDSTQQARPLPIADNTPYIFPIGNVKQDDTITFLVEIDRASLYIGHLNSELFEQGYNLLARAPLNLTQFTNTQVCGNVTALEDGLLYTSIPGDKNWSVYVDGTKSKIVLIDNAMIAVSLDKGYHEIEFRYFNTSLLVGIIVSLVSLGVFMVIALKKK